MSNEIIFLISIPVYLGAVLLVYKLYGKNGLFVFSIFATLLGNIEVSKCIDLFGFSTTAGNVIFSTTFLITDILSENHGKKDANKAVTYSLLAMVLWLLGSQIVILYTPNTSDFVSDSLYVVFGITPRITIGSLIAYTVGQRLDVYLYHKIWAKTGNDFSGLWFRNCISALISQLIDTIIFTTIAFYGIYPNKVYISIIITTFVFKAIVTLLDYPFVYLSRRVKSVKE